MESAQGRHKDVILWLSFQAGNDEALAQIYREHFDSMYRYATYLFPNSTEQILDAIHDVFLELWIKKTKLSVPNNISYYLLKSLKVRLLYLNKKDKVFHNKTRLEEIHHQELITLQPDEYFEDTKKYDNLVSVLILQLSKRQQEVLRLRFVEDLNFNEISKLLSIERQSAQNLVQRAITKLRHILLDS